MRRALIVAGVVVAVAGCSPSQLAQWQEWYALDPDAAIEYANRPEIQQQLVRVAPARLSPGRGDVWAQIARCESGARVDHPPVTNRHGTFSGYVMIGHQWWRAYGGLEFAAAPYLASLDAQLVVAERIAADVGLDRGWQCWP